MSWTEFKKFGPIAAGLLAILSFAVSALAYNSARELNAKAEASADGSVRAIVEEHGKSLTRIETKLDTLLLKQAK